MDANLTKSVDVRNSYTLDNFVNLETARTKKIPALISFNITQRNFIFKIIVVFKENLYNSEIAWPSFKLQTSIARLTYTAP